MFPTRVAFVSISLLLALGASAQGHVWVVDAASGPGADFSALQPAIDAALDGDLLLVRSGSYTHATLSAKALTIAADSGANVQSAGLRVQATAATQPVVLRGLRLFPPSGASALLSVDACQGEVWVESCYINGIDTGAVALHASPRVLIERCEIYGGVGTWNALTGTISAGKPGIALDGGQLALFECAVRGGAGHYQPQTHAISSGGAALAIASGFAHLSDSELVGGEPGSGPFCTGLAIGGAGALVQSGGWLYELGSVLLGSTGTICAAGSPGLVLAGGAYQHAVEPPCSFAAPSPLREGQAFATLAGAPAGSLLFLALDAQPGSTWLAAWHGPLLLNSLGAGSLIALGAMPASGALSTNFGALSLPPGSEQVRVFAQAGAFEPDGALVACSASSVVVLDSAF